MKKTEQRFTKSDCQIPVAELDRWANDCLADGRIRQHSPNTIATRRVLLDKFFQFFREGNYTTCGLSQLRGFFVYLSEGHESPGGRWNNPQLNQKLRPATINTYHGHLRTFFRWLVEEEILPSSPMEKIPAPVVRADQIQPLSSDQLDSLITAAKKSRHPRRDEAIVRFLYDTGVRASELVNLKVEQVNWEERCCRILGKGNKYRTVYFGQRTYKALWNYLKEDARHEQTGSSHQPLFTADRGASAGEPLTRSGLFQLIKRLGVAAGIRTVRCSPHSLRHSFAIDYLRNGGNIFSLKISLGHESLHMTNRYVALAQADLQSQHRMCSPGDRLR